MYVLAVPEVLEPSAKETEYPPLVVSDYPTGLRRTLALYAYYRSWGARVFPFLDSRVLMHVPTCYRLGFIQFSNLYYHRAIQQVEQNVNRVSAYAGRMDVCQDCGKVGSCKEICLFGLARIPRPALDDRTYVRIREALKCADAQYTAGKTEETLRESSCYIVTFSILISQLPCQQKVKMLESDVGVGNVPTGQEEWWME